MACGLFHRLLHRPLMTLRQQSRASMRNIIQHCKSRSASSSKSHSKLACTMEPPLVSITICRIPVWMNPSHIQDLINTLPSIVQVRAQKSILGPRFFDLILGFKRETDPVRALNLSADEPSIVIDHQEFEVKLLSDWVAPAEVRVGSQSAVEPSEPYATTEVEDFKILKLSDLGVDITCAICNEDLHGPFSTPCWSCRLATCYPCIRSQFRHALKDFDRFPVSCCGQTFHPDVARGILTDTELTTYKSRFEERFTQNPTYCPIPTCSAFISAQLTGHDKDGTFKCHACQTLLCGTCKQEAHSGRQCKGSTLRTETQMLILNFGYKQCPKCGTGVAKMFGCAHIRCVCGAHWCWICRKRIDLCNGDTTCDESYYNGESFDGLSNAEATVVPSDTQAIRSLQGSDFRSMSLERLRPENLLASSELVTANEPYTTTVAEESKSRRDEVEKIEQVSLPGAQSEMRAADDSSVPSPSTSVTVVVTGDAESKVESKHVNLDDPSCLAWEHGGFDFGEEPNEEDNLDIWGCLHVCEAIMNEKVPRYWMTAAIPDWWECQTSQRQIECMICWKSAKIARRRGGVETALDAEERPQHERGWKYASRCLKCNIIVCDMCETKLVKEGDEDGDK